MSRDFPPREDRRIDTHPPFSYVDDNVRLANRGDGLGNLEEKLDGLQETARRDGTSFNRTETKRIITGKQIGRKGVNVDVRGIAHTTKKAAASANKRYKSEPYYRGFAAPTSFAPVAPYEHSSSYSFEDAFRDAKTQIAAAEFTEMMKQATMVSKALEIGSVPPFVFVSFSFSRPWYQELARKVGRFFERLGN